MDHLCAECDAEIMPETGLYCKACNDVAIESVNKFDAWHGKAVNAAYDECFRKNDMALGVKFSE